MLGLPQRAAIGTFSGYSFECNSQAPDPDGGAWH